MNAARTLSLTLARRLAITRQHLAGPRPSANPPGILEVVHDLGCLQLDPTSLVAPSHLLVLWSRLGPYDTAHLDTLLWKERQLFEDWAHCSSIVPTKDYPIFSALKRGFATNDSPGAQRIRTWMEKNKKLHHHILTELRRKGPLPSRYFEDKAVEQWQSTGWTAGRNVDQMLTFLWAQGKIMVAGRSGRQKLWDLTERFLPKWTPRELLSDREVTRRAAEKSLRALGVACLMHIQHHYIRGCYTNLSDVLADLESKGRIMRVQISDAARNQIWSEKWYVHADGLPLLDRLEAGKWELRTTLLSPFDNLICDRQRTEQLFNFNFCLEMYVPKPKRKYGCYVMPILHGDRLIGRIDPVMDRARSNLRINAVYAEPSAALTMETGRAVANAVEELSTFLGAEEIVYSQRVPDSWKPVFR